MSRKIVTPLDKDYRFGMMTWSTLQRLGIVSNASSTAPTVREDKGSRFALKDDDEADLDSNAPSREEKENFRIALEVAFSSLEISEDQVQRLWEASHPLRAKDVARIARKALMKNVSQVSVDDPDAEARFARVLNMLLAGKSVSSAQIRMLVECTHCLTSETVNRVIEEKAREAYQNKQKQKELKAQEEEMFRKKFREVLTFVNQSPPPISEDTFQLLLAASVTLKPSDANAIMESVGTSWEALRERCQSKQSESSKSSGTKPKYDDDNDSEFHDCIGEPKPPPPPSKKPPQPPPPPPRRSTICGSVGATTMNMVVTEDSKPLKEAPREAPPQPPPPPPRRASIATPSDAPAASSKPAPRLSMDLLSSIKSGQQSLRKVTEAAMVEQKKKKKESSLVSQLGSMIDKRRAYIHDSDDSDSNSDFDDE